MTKHAILATGVFAAAFGYLSLFATYGVDFADEGTLVHQFERVADGQRPFVDFRPVGTPGVYWVHSALQGFFDQSIVPGRRMLALVNAGTTALVAAIVYPLVGIAGAALAGFTFLAMLPVHAGEFAAPKYFQEDAKLKFRVVLSGFFGGITVLAAWAWWRPTPGGVVPAVMGPLEAFGSYHVAVAVI